MLNARWIVPIVSIALGATHANAQDGPGAARVPFRAAPRAGGPSMALDGHRLILEEPIPDAGEDGDDLTPSRTPPRFRPALALGSARFAAVNYDDWIFGDGTTEEGGRDDLARLLTHRVAVVSARHGLAEAERSKLHLAGRGDMTRYFGRVAAEREKFDEARTDSLVGVKALMDEAAVVRALRRLEPLAREFRQGPFGDGSLFAKTLAKILSDREAAGGTEP